MPLWLKLAVAFALVAAVPVTTLGYVSGRTASDSLRQHAHAEYEQLARLSAELIRRDVDSALSQVESLAEIPVVVAEVQGQQFPGSMQAVVAGYARAGPEFNSFAVLGRDGQIRAHSLLGQGDEIGVDYPDRDAYQPVLTTGAPHVSVPRRGGVTGRPVLRIAAPVIGPTGQTVGVVIGSLTLDSLSTVLGYLRGTNTAHVAIIDTSSGLYLAHSDSGDLLTAAPPWLGEALRRAARERAGTLELRNTEGVPQLIAYSSLAHPDWIVLVTQAEADALTPAMAIQQATGTALLVVLALGLAAALALSQALAYPVARLTKAARALGRGDFSAPLPRPGHDEVSELTMAFGAMRADLARLLTEKDQAHQETLRLLHAVRRGAERVQQLAATLSAVGAASDLSAALQALLRGAVSLLDGSGGTVSVFAPKGGRRYQLRLYPDGTCAETPGTPPLAGTFQWRILQGEGPFLVHDFAQLDPATYPLSQQMHERGYRSAVNVPIDLPGPAPRRLGVLCVNSSESTHFVEDDVALAAALAGQAAAAVERARLLAAERERHRLDGALLVARTAAHELNNALSPVVGFTELLGMQPIVARDPTLASYAKAIFDGAQRAADWVRRLQHVARIEEAPSPLGPALPLLDLARSTEPPAPEG